ncbi:acetolactate synthase small subunit [Thorsellia kenyensis]|uniref:acetolactate synthase n=1 Tax=Thorsellia kenyensis TaxID=1549888 RepID=A0ABV6CCK3_9GAMM
MTSNTNITTQQNSFVVNLPSSSSPQAILTLIVNNHPGVMSHICGLFARRAYNMEGILCLPINDCDTSLSRIWLKVNEDTRLAQIIAQLKKLQDVKEVLECPIDHPIFKQVAPYFVQTL